MWHPRVSFNPGECFSGKTSRKLRAAAELAEGRLRQQLPNRKATGALDCVRLCATEQCLEVIWSSRTPEQTQQYFSPSRIIGVTLNQVTLIPYRQSANV